MGEGKNPSVIHSVILLSIYRYLARTYKTCWASLFILSPLAIRMQHFSCNAAFFNFSKFSKVFSDEGQTVASGVDINNVCNRDKTTENQFEWRSFDRIRNCQFENRIEFWKRSSFQSTNAIRHFPTQVIFLIWRSYWRSREPIRELELKIYLKILASKASYINFKF